LDPFPDFSKCCNYTAVVASQPGCILPNDARQYLCLNYTGLPAKKRFNLNTIGTADIFMISMAVAILIQGSTASSMAAFAHQILRGCGVGLDRQMRISLLYLVPARDQDARPRSTMAIRQKW
jgi:hypothetical protein